MFISVPKCTAVPISALVAAHDYSTISICIAAYRNCRRLDLMIRPTLSKVYRV